MNERRKAEIILVFVTLLWSATFLFMKNAFVDCEPLLFVTIRFSIALVCAVAIWFGSIASITKTSLRDGIILGATYSIGFFLQSWGLDHTTISKSAFITGTVVVFVPFAHWLIHRQAVQYLHILSVIVMVVGLWLFTQPEHGDFNVGDIATLGSSIIWAYYVAYLDWASNTKEHGKEYFHQLVILQFAVTVVVGLGIQFFQTQQAGFSVKFNPTKEVLLSLLYSGIAASLVATYLQTSYQRFVSPVKAGLVFVLEPVFASILAYMFYKEMLQTREIIGGVVMLSAIFFTDVISFVKTKIS